MGASFSRSEGGQLKAINVKTKEREELLEITSKVKKAAHDLNIPNGGIIVYVPHTTAGLLINESADPSVNKDIINYLHAAIPRDNTYLHQEGNSDAHIKATLVGNSQLLLLVNRELLLGKWQGIFLAEFDGPRQRQILVGKC